jgi:hypothetical protein
LLPKFFFVLIKSTTGRSASFWSEGAVWSILKQNSTVLKSYWLFVESVFFSNNELLHWLPQKKKLDFFFKKLSNEWISLIVVCAAKSLIPFFCTNKCLLVLIKSLSLLEAASF